MAENVVGINQGGTGAATANTALNALLPSQTGNSGKVLQTDGSNSNWVTPSGSSGLGAAVDIASAGTTNLGALGAAYARITGTTTITAFDTVAAGTSVWCRFAASLTLTHNATTLILPSGANIITAAGDLALMVSEGSGNWRCFSYTKASGLPVVGTYLISNGSIL